MRRIFLLLTGCAMLLFCERAFAESPLKQSEVYETKAKILDRIITNKNDSEAWLTLGNLYFDLEDHERSIEAYTKYLQLVPGDCSALSDRGAMYRTLQNYTAAIADFETCLRSGRRHMPALYNYAVIFCKDLKNDSRCKKALSMLGETYPDNEQARELIKLYK